MDNKNFYEKIYASFDDFNIEEKGDCPEASVATPYVNRTSNKGYRQRRRNEIIKNQKLKTIVEAQKMRNPTIYYSKCQFIDGEWVPVKKRVRGSNSKFSKHKKTFKKQSARKNRHLVAVDEADELIVLNGNAYKKIYNLKNNLY